jgi:hypothetical protein
MCKGPELNDERKSDLLLVLLKEQCDAMRARSEPEHLYTAAAVGSFGAVAWGVAALRPEQNMSRVFALRPAFIAAVGILAVAALIWRKIVRERGEFEKAKTARSVTAKKLAELAGNEDLVPTYMVSDEKGMGYRGSVWIVIGSAMVASLFCLSLAWC